MEITANGADALAALARAHFDLVLMDGYDATHAIRVTESGTGSHTPVIAMTAHAMKGDREICLGAGMDDYIGKPIHPQELLAVLARWSPREAVSRV